MSRYKLSFIICCITFLALQAGYAQRDVRLGLNTGINFANGTLSNQQTYSSISGITGFMIGGVVEIPLSERLTLQSEIYYMRRGGEGFGSNGQFSRNDILTLDYIDIPILLKYTFKSNSISPYILFGPDIGFNVNAEAEFNSTYSHTTKDVSKNIETINVAITIGAGVEIPISENVFLVPTLRYLFGVTNINKNSSVVIASTRDFLLQSGIHFTL